VSRWLHAFAGLAPGTHWIRGLVGLRAGLNAMVKIPLPYLCW